MERDVEGAPHDPPGTGYREELPESAALLVDLAAKWMREAGLIGAGAATVEFGLDQHGRVARWHVHTRGGRRDLEVAS